MVNIYGTKAKLDIRHHFVVLRTWIKTQTRYEAMFIANTYVTNAKLDLQFICKK